MTDYVITTGDLLEVTIPAPTEIPALIPPQQPLLGTSTNVTVDGRAVCLQGDELPTALRIPLTYTVPPLFPNPGTGTLLLTLSPANLTRQTTNGGKPILLQGESFTAMFMVETPASLTTPTGEAPDPQLEKPGTARFITSNTSVTAC